jgi:carnitine O-acetyltransferase
MASSAEAKQSIQDIETSVFVLCLDSDKPETVEELAAQVWTGKGVNRYFDKPVQFVVTGNARSGYVGEHSACDGAPSLRLNEFVQAFIQDESGRAEEDLTSSDSKSFATSDSTGFEVTALPFPVSGDSSFPKLLKNALMRFDQTVSSDDMAALRFDRFGEAAFTSRKRNPNTSVQLILNLAAYRMYGKLRPNYEPVSLSSFAGGRWTTCSMIIPEVLKFCQLADDPEAKGTTRLDAYDSAVKAHGKNVSTVANGHENTEAHLLALQKMLTEDEDTPELFLDDGFAQSQTWSLSASFMHSKHEMHYGFWPVTEDGLGLGHMIRDDRYASIYSHTHIHIQLLTISTDWTSLSLVRMVAVRSLQRMLRKLQMILDTF